MRKYKSIAEAKADGWLLVPCAFPTRNNYYYKDGEQLCEDQLVESPPPTQEQLAQWASESERRANTQ